MLGKLNWDALPLGQPIPLAAGGFVVLVLVGGVAFITLKGWVPYLWSEWITSVDHKRIGVMYVTLAAVMLLRGFTDAIMMRWPSSPRGTCRRSTTTRSSPPMARS